MKTSKQAFFLGFITVVALSACGRKSSPPATRGLETGQTPAGLKDDGVLKVVQQAKCQNQIPVDQAPEKGWREVKLPDFRGAQDAEYQLVMLRTNEVVLTQDNYVASGSVTTVIEADENGEVKAVTPTVDCKDVREGGSQQAGDVLDLSSQAVLSMNAATGKYDQLLALDLRLDAKENKDDYKIRDELTGDSYYAYWKKSEKDSREAKAKGNDLIVKYYKSTEGDIEIRIAQLDRSVKNAKQVVLNTAITYRAVKVQTPEAQK